MDKYEISKRIENFAPLDTAESWDASGWVIDNPQMNNISKIMLCLTPTEDVFSQALNEGCDMVVSHHPMFYLPFPTCVIDENFHPKLNVYSAHTNMDKANGGTTDTIIKTLGLEEYKIPIEHEFLRMVEFADGISVADFSKKISKISPNGRLVNNKNIKHLQKIAFCAGSGSEFITDAKELGADCLVTGDLKFHTALDSGIVLYDIGHFESEILILPVFEKLIGEDVEIVYAKEHSPFCLIK